ncbi:MAG TPA: Glu-tRNA(Gln) amidotransferase subunit GatD [Nitrososphaeraceae archaeon]
MSPATEGIKGYREKSLQMISQAAVSIGDLINIKTSKSEFTGILMPRYESADKNYIVIKLKSGYNIGIKTAEIQSISKVVPQDSGQNLASGILSSSVKAKTTTSNVELMHEDFQKSKAAEEMKLLPKIGLISTGGTIASKIDYRTGGVRAALSAAELYESVPELAKYAIIEPEVVLSEYSENLKPEHWTLIAKKVNEKLRSDKYQGIIISHGTDTMHYTASALSFALQNLPVPVVLVGAQRSSDRPSSDAAINLVGATIFAVKSEFTGVFVAMHASSSDDVIACHIGTRVRKNHTSRRDAFESISTKPVAIINGDTVEMQAGWPEVKMQKRKNDNNNNNNNSMHKDFLIKPDFDSKAALLKYHPGFEPELISHVVTSGHKAIVLEGTGLGHISRECFPQIRNAIESGVMVFMTSQCIWGRTKMTVYDTGRDLLNMGVIPLSDMISETAVVKAMWVLANSNNSIEYAKILMQKNIANEMSAATPIS